MKVDGNLLKADYRLFQNGQLIGKADYYPISLLTSSGEHISNSIKKHLSSCSQAQDNVSFVILYMFTKDQLFESRVNESLG